MVLQTLMIFNDMIPILFSTNHQPGHLVYLWDKVSLLHLSAQGCSKYRTLFGSAA